MENTHIKMKFLHNVTITVFIDSEEDEKHISEQIALFLPEHFVEEKIAMEISSASVEEGRSMQILKVHLTKERHTKYVLQQLKNYLGKEACDTIVSQENRVDESCKLFIRIDKKEFIEHNNAVLTDSGKCIHFALLIAAYPKNRGKALERVKEMFS